MVSGAVLCVNPRRVGLYMDCEDCWSEPDLVVLLKGSRILEKMGFELLREEWDVVQGHSQYGKGDLLYVDRTRRLLLVVEVKYLDPPGGGETARRRRSLKRTKVREQALYYASIIRQRAAGAWEVHAAVFTNDWRQPGLVWL